MDLFMIVIFWIDDHDVRINGGARSFYLLVSYLLCSDIFHWYTNGQKMNRDDWMYKALRQSEIYVKGVKSFLRVAEAHRTNKGSRSICCPCSKCQNFKYCNDTNEIETHLFENGFKPRYHCWSRHGESLVDFSTSSTTNDNTYNNGPLNLNGDDENSNDPKDDENHSNDPNDNTNEMLHDMETNMGDAKTENLQHLLEDAKNLLYPGSNFKKLDTVLNLLNLKSKNGWSDKSFTELLVFWHDRLPRDNELPISTYQAKKLMCPMGLEVERIHACPNNCILYRNQYENEHKCVVCGASRLFSNEKEAKLLRWHSEERVIDGKLRHVADSPQWQTIDNKYHEFGKEARNIRFGLSSDGINPFGSMSSRHSTWPVLLCIYNLPPWLCMKRKYIMMSLLIQGPWQPGNNIDVYLSPLIDDLKTLWDSGVNVYDAYKKEHFQLRAMIFCTINDFPAYGNLPGYKVKGKKACRDTPTSYVDEGLI
ncbi:uncharacterized protein LOC143571294 [Bidens hawaiensis]|uniref:uncharacterized protein LOC143571294 n=1 Tax=Bidens hawaiensis TaxID=980011 RepID=UPI00404981A9